jgi:hypothetical protein
VEKFLGKIRKKILGEKFEEIYDDFRINFELILKKLERT